MERLVNLLDLGLHQQFHVEGDLAAAAGDQPEETSDLGNAVAHRVPGNFRLAELELLHQFVLDLQAILAERRQRACGTAEFADQHARFYFIQALPVTLECRQHGRHLVAEGDRHGLLEIAASRHRRVAVFLRKRGKSVADAFDFLLDDHERFADLHDGRRVGDVLRGGAPMRPFAKSVLAEFHQLLHHGQNRIPDPFGCFLEFRHVDFVGRAVTDDFGGRFFWDDAEPGLRARERGFEIEIFLHAVLVGEHVAHGLRGENVAKHRGIEDR